MPSAITSVPPAGRCAVGELARSACSPPSWRSPWQRRCSLSWPGSRAPTRSASPHVAQSEEMAAEATNLFSANAPLAMLLSVQAYKRARTVQARSALIEAARQPLGDLLAEGSTVDSVAFSPDGRTLAAGDSGGGVGLWDTASGAAHRGPGRGQPRLRRGVQPGRPDARGRRLGGGVGLWAPQAAAAPPPWPRAALSSASRSARTAGRSLLATGVAMWHCYDRTFGI